MYELTEEEKYVAEKLCASTGNAVVIEDDNSAILRNDR